MKLHETGAYLVNGCTVVEDNSEASAAIASMTGTAVSKEEAATVGLKHVKKNDITENDIRKDQGLNPRGAYKF